MGKLIVNVFMTLDGVFEAPERWSFPYFNEEIGSIIQTHNDAADAILLGRKTYDIFASAWPGRTDDKGIARKINSMPKYVASRTREALEWNNSHLLGSDPLVEVVRLKDEVALLTMPGSGTFARALLERGLVDELRLLVYPLVLGEGDRFFEGSDNVRLDLIESRPVGSGVVMQCYRPVA